MEKNQKEEKKKEERQWKSKKTRQTKKKKKKPRLSQIQSSKRRGTFRAIFWSINVSRWHELTVRRDDTSQRGKRKEAGGRCSFISCEKLEILDFEMQQLIRRKEKTSAYEHCKFVFSCSFVHNPLWYIYPVCVEKLYRLRSLAVGLRLELTLMTIGTLMPLSLRDLDSECL